MAELIIFEVDRFFDYMDLANMNIYVQWQLPDENKTTGATEITIIDLESGKDKGKIRFAWPLNNAITAHNGIVKFSVRFFLINENGELAYSLNTTDSGLIVKAALDPKVAPDKIEQLGSLFESAVINSAFGSQGVTPPIIPTFSTPGLDMTVEDTNDFVRYLTDDESEPKTTRVAKLGADDKLTLRVQAVAPDSGTIRYEWKYKSDEKDSTWGPATVGTVKTIIEKAVLPVDATGRPYLSASEKYYSDENGTQLYTSTNVPNYDLYEKYSVYEIQGVEGTPVTGTYAAVAINGIKISGSPDVESTPRWSANCYLPGPKEVQFNSKEFNFTKEENGSYTVTPNLVEDINHPDIENHWYRSQKSAEDALTFTSECSESDLFKPGWYAVEVHSKLNLTEKTKRSTKTQMVCAAPAIARVDPADGDPISFPIPAKAIQKLTIQPVIDKPASLTDADASRDLYANLSYEWYYKAPNSNKWYKIEEYQISETDDTRIVAKIESDNIKSVLYARNIDDENPYRYKCKVTNTLNGESVSMEQTNDRAFLVF